MSQYTKGTATVTNTDATVTGTATLWSSEASAGDLFAVVGDGTVYEIASITSDTELELTQPYAGFSLIGADYIIARDFSPINEIPLLNPGDLEASTIYNRAMDIIDGLL